MHWYAVHTKPRQEDIARRNLEREGVEVFAPKLRRRRTIRRVRKWVTGPLFPCYVFARFDVAQSSRLVKYANGVTNIVNFGGRPAIVDEAIIAAIHDHCTLSSVRRPQTADQSFHATTSSLQSDVSSPIFLDTVVIQPPQLQAGDVVVIQTGPFQGLQGIFEREMSDHDRVMILLDALAKGARVQVARDELEKV